MGFTIPDDKEVIVWLSENTIYCQKQNKYTTKPGDFATDAGSIGYYFHKRSGGGTPTLDRSAISNITTVKMPFKEWEAIDKHNTWEDYAAWRANKLNYTVVLADAPYTLSASVHFMLDHGWKCQGGISMVNNQLAQAMVRGESTEIYIYSGGNSGTH